jgi:glycerophosphoryl diester phosphodiesterase
MPYLGSYTQEDYVHQIINEYIEAGVVPENVWPQSFTAEDCYYWVANTNYGAQSVALDGE